MSKTAISDVKPKVIDELLVITHPVSGATHDVEADSGIFKIGVTVKYETNAPNYNRLEAASHMYEPDGAGGVKITDIEQKILLVKGEGSYDGTISLHNNISDVPAYRIITVTGYIDYDNNAPDLLLSVLFKAKTKR